MLQVRNRGIYISSCLSIDEQTAHMAEELQDAAYTLPRVIVWATFINGGMMFIMCITFCYCVGDDLAKGAHVTTHTTWLH